MHRPTPRPILLTRAVVRALVVIGLGFLGLVALIYFKQHSMIYHPRPYGPSYTQVLPPNGEEISHTLPFGKHTAFYIPARDNGRLLARLWIAFDSNGWLALDWTTVVGGSTISSD